jgi:hypothetical protein
MCGAVRYEAVGDPTAVAHCHCESCRRHSGAPAVTPNLHVFHSERLSWFDTADHLPRYRTSRFGDEPYLRKPASEGLPG